MSDVIMIMVMLGSHIVTFHHLAEFFFSGMVVEVEVEGMVTLQFHKNCQNIFQNDAIFYQIYIFGFGWFSFHVMSNR